MRLPKSDFAKNVFTVMGGATLAQALPVALSPILTRLYSPTDFGAFALYISILAIAVVVATGRYELAILLPRKDGEAFDVLIISVLMTLVVSGLLFICILFTHGGIVGSFHRISILGNWLYTLPLSVLLMGGYQSLAYWGNREKRYKNLSMSRIAQASTMCSVQIAIAVGGLKSVGLIAGYIVGQLAGNGLLFRSTWKGAQVYLKQVSFLRLLAVIRRHRNFPKFMIPGQLANVASSQMPVLLLGLLHGPAIAGFYALAERVLVIPTSLIGSAIGDVYRQEASRMYYLNGNCRQLYLRTAKKLAFIGLFPLVFAVVTGPWLFSLFFGPAWAEAGKITALLGVMVFFQVISSPLSQTVLLAKMQHLDMVWQITRLILAVGSIYLGHMLSNTYELSIILYVASFSVLYMLHSLMQYKAACGAKLSFLTRKKNLLS